MAVTASSEAQHARLREARRARRRWVLPEPASPVRKVEVWSCTIARQTASCSAERLSGSSSVARETFRRLSPEVAPEVPPREVLGVADEEVLAADEVLGAAADEVLGETAVEGVAVAEGEVKGREGRRRGWSGTGEERGWHWDGEREGMSRVVGMCLDECLGQRVVPRTLERECERDRGQRRWMDMAGGCREPGI